MGIYIRVELGWHQEPRVVGFDTHHCQFIEGSGKRLIPCCSVHPAIMCGMCNDYYWIMTGISISTGVLILFRRDETMQEWVPILVGNCNVQRIISGVNYTITLYIYNYQYFIYVPVPHLVLCFNPSEKLASCITFNCTTPLFSTFFKNSGSSTSQAKCETVEVEAGTIYPIYDYLIQLGM